MKTKLKIRSTPINRIDVSLLDKLIANLNGVCFPNNKLFLDCNKDGDLYCLFFDKGDGYILDNATVRECYLFIQGIREHHIQKTINQFNQ